MPACRLHFASCPSVLLLDQLLSTDLSSALLLGQRLSREQSWS